MNVDRLLRLPVVIVRTSSTGTADAFGDPTEQTTELTVRGWIWQDNRTDVDTANRSLAAEEWTFALDASAAGNVAARDRLRVNGATYEVDGPPWTATNPRTGRVEYVQGTARRTS